MVGRQLYNDRVGGCGCMYFWVYLPKKAWVDGFHIENFRKLVFHPYMCIWNLYWCMIMVCIPMDVIKLNS